MAFDAFLKVDGIKGESTRKGHAGEIELISFSLGASNPTSIGSGGGGGSGKVTVSSFNCMKKTDKASPTLFQKCCEGHHVPKATVTLYKAGGSEAVDYLKYEFEKVYVESIQWSGASGGDDVPMESLSLAFGKITATYTEQKDDGTKGASIVGTWDLMQVTA
jgi:type VI secretion system secreted protein Hcp